MERRTSLAALRRDLQRVLPGHRMKGTKGSGLVVRPDKPGELQQIVRIAWDAEVPVLPMGIAHEQVQPPELHLRLDMGRFNRILGYDASSGLVTVQAGVTLEGLADWLSSKKMTLPVHCAGDDRIQLWEFLTRPWAGGYGPAMGHKLEQVVALAALLPTGEEITTTVSPRRAAGPDPTRLLLGGGGRFGLLSRVTLRVVDAPVRVARLAFGGPHLARYLDMFWDLSERIRPVEVRIIAQRRTLDVNNEGTWYTHLWTLWGEGRDLVRRKEMIIKGVTPAFSTLRLQNPYEFEGVCPLAGGEGPYTEFTAQRRDLVRFCARLSGALLGERLDAFRVFGFHAGAASVGVQGDPGAEAGAAGSCFDDLADGLDGVYPGCAPPALLELRDKLSDMLDPRGIFSQTHLLWSGGDAS